MLKQPVQFFRLFQQSIILFVQLKQRIGVREFKLQQPVFLVFFFEQRIQFLGVAVFVKLLKFVFGIVLLQQPVLFVLFVFGQLILL